MYFPDFAEYHIYYEKKCINILIMNAILNHKPNLTA